MNITIDVTDLTEAILDFFSHGDQVLIVNQGVFTNMHIRLFDDIFLVKNVSNGRERQLLTIKKL